MEHKKYRHSTVTTAAFIPNRRSSIVMTKNEVKLSRIRKYRRRHLQQQQHPLFILCALTMIFISIPWNKVTTDALKPIRKYSGLSVLSQNRKEASRGVLFYGRGGATSWENNNRSSTSTTLTDSADNSSDNLYNSDVNLVPERTATDTATDGQLSEERKSKPVQITHNDNANVISPPDEAAVTHDYLSSTVQQAILTTDKRSTFEQNTDTIVNVASSQHTSTSENVPTSKQFGVTNGNYRPSIIENESKSQSGDHDINSNNMVVAAIGTLSQKNEEDSTIVNIQSVQPKPADDDPQILFLIRVLFLSYYASLGALMPYLPVYYHSLGHGGQIIGMLGAVKPLTTFIVAPFWGLIADQTQAPFTILKVTFLISLMGQLLVAGSHDFRYIMFMVFLTAVFNAPVKSLIDSMVMDHINDRSQYGRLRLWGQLGFGLGSSGVGVLLSRSKGFYDSTATSIPPSMVDSIARLPTLIQKFIRFADKFWHAIFGYRLLFLTHAALSVPTWLAIRSFEQLDKESKEVKARKAKKNKLKTTEVPGGARIKEGLKLLISNGDALLFFFLIFVVGVSSGIIENFAYVRLREVGGSGRAMGLSRLVSSIAGAPMFWFSGPLTESLGADRVLVLSLLSYVVRFIIYALMRHPLHGLPAEALRGITFAAFWSTGTVYAHRISPDGLHATMLMFLNAMYGGLGQSLGAIVGGKMQSKFGTVMTFIYSAAIDLCFVGFVIFYLRLRKDSDFRNPYPITRTPT